MDKIEQTCPSEDCGVTFWTTAGYDSRRREDHKSFHCPNGHSMSYPGKTDRQLLNETRNEKANLQVEVASLQRKLKKCAKKKP